MEHSNEHRRTIGKHSEVTTKRVSSRNSFVAFFFGQPKESAAAAAAKTPSPTAASAKHHISQQRRVVENGVKRHQLSRDNSIGSFSSALSKKSASSINSARETPSIRTYNSRLTKSDEVREKGDSRLVALSLKLGMWESADGAVSPRHKSSKSKDRQRRVLTRDNSTGSNISNISNLSNNSNISIISASSTGSGKSQRLSPGAGYDPVAAAAASRERYFLQAQEAPPGDMRSPGGSRVIPVREPSFGSHSLSAGSMAGSCEGTAAPTPTSQRSSSLRSLPPSKEVSLHSIASHELMVESSPEPSPPCSPRKRSEDVAGIRQPPGEDGRCEPARASSPTPAPVPSSTTTEHGARIAGLVAGVVLAQSALKRAEQKRSMSPLVSRAGGVLSARNSWMADRDRDRDREALQRPRLVQFTSSTKSMGTMRGAEGVEGQATAGAGSAGGALDEATVAEGKGVFSAAPVTADLEIEGAIVVEDEEEEREGDGGAFAGCDTGSGVPVSPCSVTVGTPIASAAPAMVGDEGRDGEVISEGTSGMSLAELVRRNKSGDLGGLAREQLEMHLSDAEFTRAFRLTREAFHELPVWRQRNQKRSVGLL